MAIEKPLMLDGHEISITASLGISLYPDDGEDADTLLKNANIAMSHAKKLGRNNYQFFKPALREKTKDRLNMEKGLQLALERDEFQLYYQPQVDINSGSIVGTEALIRWKHPDRGLVPPNDFIPLAEGSGLIIPISEWVLQSACQQNKAWQSMGLPQMRVTINLSANTFLHKNLLNIIVNALKGAELDPKYVGLEITESTAMHDTNMTINKLNKINKLGIEIAIDTFGTGYSSLSYLK